MRDSRSDRPISRIPFDPREERIIDGLARWMGVLGRFQVLAGGLLLLAALGAGIAYATTEPDADPLAAASDTTPPLVQLGEVPTEFVIGAAVVVILVGGLLLRGGVLLTDAAEDFERVVHTDGRDQHHLENALRRLRSYYRMELLLAGLLLAAVLWWAAPWWT